MWLSDDPALDCDWQRRRSVVFILDLGSIRDDGLLQRPLLTKANEKLILPFGRRNGSSSISLGTTMAEYSSF
jgi:hypothetical protein